MLALVLVGCESNIEHPIAGHTYSKYGGSSVGSLSVYAHFAANGNFDIDYMEKTWSGYEHNRYAHMKWSVNGNQITVKRDNSTYWKSSSRGTVVYTGSYDASDNSVTLDGQKYKYTD